MGRGREGESGHVSPSDAVKPGDLIYVKDPYGIGEDIASFLATPTALSVPYPTWRVASLTGFIASRVISH